MARFTKNLPFILLILYAGIWLAWAIHPLDRADWWLENVLVFIAVPLLIFFYRRLPFSNLAYLCLFVFFSLHSIGSHYTYSKVPYDAFFDSLTGISIDDAFDFDRNHFDRLVHFLYGLLAMPAVVDLFKVKAPAKGVWRVLLPVFFVASHSVLYEVIEWLAAEVFGGDLGQAYVGTQGDEWDAQKDMALATLGAAIGMALLELRRVFRRR
jgi:putative membrane protein